MRVAKPFQYSADGITAQKAAPGDDASLIPVALMSGLIKEGFVLADGAAAQLEPPKPPTLQKPAQRSQRKSR